MQLGARWQTGSPPHRSVPPQLFSAISEQELAHPSAESWTLTWLEGRPRVALDDLVVLSVDAAGKVRLDTDPSGITASAQRDDEELDDWLS